MEKRADDSIKFCFKSAEQRKQKSEERFSRLLQENLIDIASSLISDHDSALDRILGIMQEITGFPEGLLLLHSASLYTKKAVRGKHAQTRREATVLENDPTIKAITESKNPLLLTDIDLKYFNVPTVARTLLGIPVISQEEVTAIVIMHSDDIRVWQDIDLEDLATFTAQAGIAIGYIRLFSEAKKLATTDGLTGLHNQTHLLTLAEIEYKRAERYNHPLSVIMISVDRLREINDKYSHVAGNHILKILSKTIAQTVRNTDLAGRYSGDGFIVVLPETDPEQAKTFADRLLRALLIEPFAVPGHGAIQVTISIGISCLDDGSRCFYDIFEKAYKALYQSIKRGGNQVTTLV